jgi:hypothetical protein
MESLQLKKLLENPYVMAVIKIVLILYAVQLYSPLPSPLNNYLGPIFSNILALAFLIYISEHDIQLALILAILYVGGLQFFKKSPPQEGFAPYSAEYEATGKEKLIEPKTMVYPGCLNITMADLENAFDGDNMKLQKAVQYSFVELMSKLDKSGKENLLKIAYATGLPYNVKFNDENAPLIATILLNYGYKLSNTCLPPQ